MMNLDRKKRFAAGLSISSNIVLTFLKIIAGILSGSLSIISEAIHSVSDFMASILTFFSVVKSSQPADADHPYGHGKYEDMAGFLEGILIIFASVFIIYKAAKKIIFGLPFESENDIGIAVMLIAVIMNFFVSKFLFTTAKESNSVSLYADGEHLRTDVYSSLGVLIGLVLIKITGHTILDPVIAILVAVLIYNAGYSISKKSLMRLLDYSLPDSDIEKIKSIITSYENVKLKKDSIKARQIGPSEDIDFILQFPEDTSICECHKICEKIEKQIRSVYIGATISIHSEPICYKKNCQNHCPAHNKVCSK
ncbi:cation transporter [bacterium]|nr:cation transporter [bacterium]